MPAFDPAAMIFTTMLVSLVTVLVLLLSPTAAEHRHSVRLWVAGEVLGLLARTMTLAQQAAPGQAPIAGAETRIFAALNGPLFIAVAVLHALAVRSTMKRSDGSAAIAGSFAAVAACSAITVAIPGGRLGVSLTLAGLLACSVWTAAIALPWRKRFRGALLISVSMGMFALMESTGLLMMLLAPASGDRLAPQPPALVLVVDMLASLMFTMGFLMAQFELLHHRIQHLSVTDPLTGALNRRGFLQRMEALGDAPVSLAILDLDHFKRINDTLGHSRGDEALTGFVRRLQEVTRATDVLGRWGGEEFVLLMPATDADGARLLAERARAAVAGAPLAAGLPQVTVSAGLATGAPAAAGWIDELLARADGSLYRAKERRDCVVAWQDAAPAGPSPAPHVRRLGEVPAA